jgi:hypothetical protein
MDGTSKSQACLELGKRLSQRYKTHTKFLRIKRYGAHLLDYIYTTKIAAEKNLEEIRDKLDPEPGFKAEINLIAGVLPEKARDLIEGALKESGGALGLLINKIEDFRPDLVILPVPFAEESEMGEELGKDSLGTALDLILRRTSRNIPILLVEGESLLSRRNVLCVFNPEQQVESVKITLIHALKLADAGSDVTLLGIIGPSLVETFAGVFGEVSKEEPDFSKAKNGLKLRMEHLLDAIQLNVEKKVNLKRKVAFGRIDEVLKETIAETDPGLIVYQSKYLPHDPLDSMADEIARHESQVPVLIVWE